MSKEYNQLEYAPTKVYTWLEAFHHHPEFLTLPLLQGVDYSGSFRCLVSRLSLSKVGKPFENKLWVLHLKSGNL